jgi:diguanylate cyclase (GGDEF)-like protein
MITPPLPRHESARLQDLAHYEVLDTGTEEAFDRLTRLAARTLRAPVSVINFVDQTRQWGKSCFGMLDSTAPRDHSFCAWTILTEDVLVVEDTLEDPRFSGNPMVTSVSNVRFYAGAPLTTPEGHHIGSICVVDTRPRQAEAEDLVALQDLATLVMQELETRLHTLRLERTMTLQGQTMKALQQDLKSVQTLEAVNALLDSAGSPEEVTHAAAALIGQAIHADWTGLLTFEGESLAIRAAHHQQGTSQALLDFAGRLPSYASGVSRQLRDITAPHYIEDYARQAHAIPEGVAAGLSAAAWLPLGSYLGTTFMLVAVRAERGPRDPWRLADKTLLDAAGRSVRTALERRVLQEVGLKQARMDALTGIPNRRAFDEDFARLQEEGSAQTLVSLDLDGFKRVNDSEGHLRGDEVLSIFAQVLSLELGSRGHAYRTGGDEFTLLVPGHDVSTVISSAVDMAVLAARAVTGVGLGASVGQVEIPVHGLDGPAVLRLADERMYNAKSCRQ